MQSTVVGNNSSFGNQILGGLSLRKNSPLIIILTWDDYLEWKGFHEEKHILYINFWNTKNTEVFVILLTNSEYCKKVNMNSV
jgi:hypothetical protein